MAIIKIKRGNSANLNNITIQYGELVYTNDNNKLYIGNSAGERVLVGGTLTKTDVGLGNVDNTSDANKPLSNAMNTALIAKANVVDTIREVDSKDAVFFNNPSCSYSYIGSATQAVSGEIGLGTTRRNHIIYTKNPNENGYGSQLAIEYSTGAVKSGSHNGTVWTEWLLIVDDRSPRNQGQKDAASINQTNILYPYFCDISDTQASSASLPIVDWYHIIHTPHINAGGYSSQLAITLHGNNIYLRTSSSGTWKPWVKLLVDYTTLEHLAFTHSIRLFKENTFTSQSNSYIFDDSDETYDNGLIIRNHTNSKNYSDWWSRATDILLSRDSDNANMFRINSDSFGWSPKKIYGEHNVTCSQTTPTSFIGEGCIHMTY